MREPGTPEVHRAPTILVLDLAGVVFHFEHSHRLEIMAKETGLSAEEVDQRFWGSGFSAACDAGEYSLDEALAYLRSHMAWNGTDADLEALWCSAYWPDEEVIAKITSYGVPLAGFTNNGPIEDHWMRETYPEIFTLLGHTWFAHTLKVNKPAAAAYEAVARGLNRRPAEIAFIDDSQKNVDGALAAGWHADLYSDPDALDASIYRWFVRGHE